MSFVTSIPPISRTIPLHRVERSPQSTFSGHPRGSSPHLIPTQPARPGYSMLDGVCCSIAKREKQERECLKTSHDNTSLASLWSSILCEFASRIHLRRVKFKCTHPQQHLTGLPHSCTAFNPRTREKRKSSRRWAHAKQPSLGIERKIDLVNDACPLDCAGGWSWAFEQKDVEGPR